MIDSLREQIQERLDQLVHEADRLRKALAAEGIVLTDGKDGSTTWTVAGA